MNTISFRINRFIYQGFKIWSNLPKDVDTVSFVIITNKHFRIGANDSENVR